MRLLDARHGRSLSVLVLLPGAAVTTKPDPLNGRAWDLVLAAAEYESPHDDWKVFCGVAESVNVYKRQYPNEDLRITVARMARAVRGMYSTRLFSPGRRGRPPQCRTRFLTERLRKGAQQRRDFSAHMIRGFRQRV